MSQYTAVRSFGTWSEVDMMEALIKEVSASHDTYQHFVMDTFPRLRNIHERCICGSFSWTLPDSKRRLIYAPNAVYLDGKVCTPGDIARWYLKVKYPRRLRCSTAQYEEFAKHRHHPLYAIPCMIEDGYYVDCVSAYWSILKVVGWDVEYMPGRLLGVGSLMTDFPFAGNKLARNCLITNGIAMTMKLWDGKEQRLLSMKQGSPKRNLGLWAIVQDVLNGLAVDVIRAGALYVHTDGYICSGQSLPRVMEAIASWGLPAKIKYQGKATIYGSGAYDIDKHVHKQLIAVPQPIDSLCAPNHHEWLRAKFRYHAERTFEE